MKRSNAAIWLSWLVVALALVSAVVGAFWQGGGGPFAFTTLRGETVEIAGQGLYRYDTSFKAPIQRGSDVVTLLVSIPLLVLATLRYRRGSLRGGLLLAGALGCLLYNAASLAFGAAYNSLFLVYIAWFSASLFALVLVCRSIDLAALPARVSPRLPRRGIAVFVMLSGLTLCVWLVDIISALAQGQPPAGLASNTTEVTSVIDLGIIMPTAIFASIALLRRAGPGYLFTTVILVLNAIIGVTVLGQTVVQTLDGITLTVAEYVAKVGVFTLTGLIASALVAAILRSVAEPAAQPPAALQAARA
ncbi:MAG: hypothetical protein IPO81_13495 [Kouleothrix sp.]|nr:hypothetical protein [Kouleothrix sp.]